MLKPESWAVIAVAAFGIVAAIFAFLRTPPEQRLRMRPPSLDERLAQAPPEARAVIIRADRRRALRRDLPGNRPAPLGADSPAGRRRARASASIQSPPPRPG
jgi:hypothetical protein